MKLSTFSVRAIIIVLLGISITALLLGVGGLMLVFVAQKADSWIHTQLMFIHNLIDIVVLVLPSAV